MQYSAELGNYVKYVHATSYMCVLLTCVITATFMKTFLNW